MSFPDEMSRRLGQDPGQPFVTAYDDASGERTELSVTTWGNWVNKTANVLLEECELGAGDTLRLALPAHWLVPVFLGAAWTAGIAVTTDEDIGADLVVTGPEPVETTLPVLACSLLPFGVRFPEPPAGLDFGVLWPGQPDDFLGLDPVDDQSVAWRDHEGEHTLGALLAEARTVAPGRRLLTDAHPAVGRGVALFLGPLVTGGSVVLVRNPEEGRWPARQEDERATAIVRAADQLPSS